MKNKILASLCLLLTLLSCTKDKDESRRTGDETISCYIDGKLWQNSSSLASSGGVSVSSFSALGGGGNDYYHVGGSIWGESYLYVMAIHSRKSDSGEYALDDSKGIMNVLQDKKQLNTIAFSNDNGRYLCKKEEGWIRIEDSFDPITNKRLRREGTFEATLYNEEDPTDIIYITDGRFTRIYP